MTPVLWRNIRDHIGQSVCIKGWVIHHRPSGIIVFVEVRDGTGTIQCVVIKNEVNMSSFENARKLLLETSIVVEGVVRQDDRSKNGCEITVSRLDVINESNEEYPISEKEHGVAFLMDNRHLWLRSSRQNIILRIRATIIRSIREYLDEQGFINFDTPIFTPTVCEGTTTLFETDYFNDKAYLTQSGQLYCEAGAFALGRVYSFGPAFRAEKSKTRRHLTEFWMVEPEAAFFDLDDDMIVAGQRKKRIHRRTGRLTETQDIEALFF